MEQYSREFHFSQGLRETHFQTNAEDSQSHSKKCPDNISLVQMILSLLLCRWGVSFILSDVLCLS